MPPLKPPAQQTVVNLPPARALDAGETDVLIVGGGPAGLGAALGAAWSGAGTVLCEQYGFLGGNATAALVAPLASWYTQSPSPEREGAPDLLPTDHGEGRPAIGGALAVLVERLVRIGGAVPPASQTGYVLPFDAEAFKHVACELLDEAGVHFLLHAFAVDAFERACPHVVFATKSGLVVLRARAVVDCTGDGDIAARLGARYEVGREDGLVQPMSLIFQLAHFQHAAFATYVAAHPRDWRGVHGLWDLVCAATEAGELDLPREDILFFATPRPDEVTVNSTRIVKVLGTDVWDLTYAEWAGRRQMRQLLAFFTKYVPGFSDTYVAESAATVGVRESRRILGDYVLTEDDILAARRFDDVIAHGTYPIDIHNPAGHGTLLKRVPADAAYDIPLRCLLPGGLDTVVTAGRCISGTHEALSSYRVMPISMATGQAAGVCAALAVRHGVPPRRISPADVQRALKDQKAIFLH